MKEPKRYDMNWDYPQIVQLETDFGKGVTYSAYLELLNQFDKLEEAAEGYWIGDEFIVK